MHFWASAEKAKRELGWQPRHDFLADCPALVRDYLASGRQVGVRREEAWDGREARLGCQHGTALPAACLQGWPTPQHACRAGPLRSMPVGLAQSYTSGDAPSQSELLCAVQNKDIDFSVDDKILSALRVSTY